MSIKTHKNRVAALGCMVCQALGLGQTPAQLHHIREGQGMGQRASDWLVVPLCPDHHTGPRGVHGDQTDLRIAKVTEMDLLAMTLEALDARH